MHMGHHYQLIAPERITRTAGLSLKPGLAEHLAEERLVSERGPLQLSWSCGPALQVTPLSSRPSDLATQRPMKYTGRRHSSRGGW